MPMSLKYGIILVHVPKTAGTSIEKVLDVYGRRECLHGVVNNVCLQHLTATEIIKAIGEDLYRNFFSLAFVRNPWDRCVSDFAFYKKVGASIVSGLTFTQFVNKLPIVQGSVPDHIYQHLRPQSDYLFDQSGNCLVDYIGAFENLDKHWNDVVRKIHSRSGLHVKNKLPKNQVSQHDHYSTYYNSQTRDWIAKVYEDDLKLNHYKFESR